MRCVWTAGAILLKCAPSRCAAELIADAAKQKQVVLDLIAMASGPPDPQVRPRLQAALETYASGIAKRARANPRLRANVLMPAARLGIREEMKQAFGYNWRAHVRSVTSSLDPAENLALRTELNKTLASLNKRWASRLKPGYTLDPVKGGADYRMPDVVVVAGRP